jgi:DNA-binding NarL/FixJ family response regulator
LAEAVEASSAEAGASKGARTVAILADDLIWATRLGDAVRAAGAQPKAVHRVTDLEALLPGAAGQAAISDVIIDLTARAYDGVAAIRLASGTGARIVAVGQHDDIELRRAATEAGASRVFTYRALFEDGPRLLRRWLAG